jgi:putative transposase
VKIQRAFKVRLYPTPEQRVFLNKTLGSCRFLYNLMLAERIETYKTLKDNREALYTHKYKTEKEYKAEHEFLKEVDAFALQQARRNLEAAYASFCKSLKGLRKGEAVGFPRFKSKHNHNGSCRTGMSIAVHFEGQTVKLPKITEPVRFKHRVNIKSWYRAAELKNITVSKSPTGTYYASCLFEGEQDFQGIAAKAEKIIGLDMSLRDFYVDNLGNSPEYRRVYRASGKALAKYQRRLSRKPKGSRNSEKARVKAARIHERIGNCRRNFIDALSYRLVREYDVIVVENLSLKGMSQALNLGKSVMDLGYAAFVNKLQYKALWNDKTVIAADKWFASSKTCHVCGYVKKDLLLQEREWVCPNCGARHNRDKNAAINLAAINLAELGKIIPMQRGKLTSVDMGALALGSKGETAVETPAMGKSRNLEEQASKETQAPAFRQGVADH